MTTAPRTGHTQLYLFGGGIHLQVTFQCTDLKTVTWRTSLNEVRQELVAPGLMMTIEFTIGGNNDDLSFTGLLFAFDEMSRQVGGGEEVGIAGGVPIKRNTTGEWSIVEEDGDASPAGQAYQVWLRGIDRGSSLPGSNDGIGNAM